MVQQTLTDEELIARYIDPNPRGRGAAEARLRESGVAVWALVGHLPGVDGDIERLAESYDVPVEAVRAALAYYDRYTCLIDARLAENSALA